MRSRKHLYNISNYIHIPHTVIKPYLAVCFIVLVCVYRSPVWRRIPIYLLQKTNKCPKTSFCCFIVLYKTSVRSTIAFLIVKKYKRKNQCLRMASSMWPFHEIILDLYLYHFLPSIPVHLGTPVQNCQWES